MVLPLLSFLITTSDDLSYHNRTWNNMDGAWQGDYESSSRLQNASRGVNLGEKRSSRSPYMNDEQMDDRFRRPLGQSFWAYRRRFGTYDSRLCGTFNIGSKLTIVRIPFMGGSTRSGLDGPG
jgi:hypothetical protein